MDTTTFEKELRAGIETFQKHGGTLIQKAFGNPAEKKCCALSAVYGTSQDARERMEELFGEDVSIFTFTDGWDDNNYPGSANGHPLYELGRKLAQEYLQ